MYSEAKVGPWLAKATLQLKFQNIRTHSDEEIWWIEEFCASLMFSTQHHLDSKTNQPCVTILNIHHMAFTVCICWFDILISIVALSIIAQMKNLNTRDRN